MPQQVDDTEDLSNKKALVAFIASNLAKFVQNPNDNSSSMLLLVAALSLLNLGDDQQTINTARRLAQLSLSKTSKPKKK
jgi:hypothetical protein